MNKEELIQSCRYYKGEEECPESTKNQLFWDYEKKWVEDNLNNNESVESWRKTVERKQLGDFATMHNVPETLVGLLYNRFMHWGSGYETTDDFYHWMEEQYL